MAKFDVVDMSGKKVSKVELSDAVFGIKPNERAMHAAVVNYLANQRQGTQSTKTRGEVRGGGRKPWRQKGTGRARQGSIRSPQWTGGGVALGPKPRDYSYRINRKVKRLALLSALSAKAAAGEIIVVDEFKVDEYKTKAIVKMLGDISASGKALIVTDAVNEKMVKSAANIPGVKTTTASLINVYDILNAGTFVVSVDAAKKIEEVFAQ
ncbi:50S ribosomal protein L4 [Ruminococcaceae bacterium OttesenSCG-928-O06]|nr:50S ribosomal protein L4 [Ruminococcaceae bacterium OttesenSCG-928-O06]